MLFRSEGVDASAAARDVELNLVFTGDGGACDDAVRITVIDVEVEMNNTPAQNDDAVRVKSDVPVSDRKSVV